MELSGSTYFKNCGNTSTSGSLLPRTKKEEFFIKQIPFVLWAKKAFFFGWMVDDFADKFIVIYSRVHISSDTAFLKILKKPSIVQE